MFVCKCCRVLVLDIHSLVYTADLLCDTRKSATAFQACQAVQARVIDTLFGIISCRDKSLAVGLSACEFVCGAEVHAPGDGG